MVLFGHHRYLLIWKVNIATIIIIAFRTTITILLFLRYSFVHIEKLDLLDAGWRCDGAVSCHPSASGSYRKPEVLTWRAIFLIILACPLLLLLILYHLCDVVFGGGLKRYLIWVYLCHIILFDHEHLLSLLIDIDFKIIWGDISSPRPGPASTSIDHDTGGLLLACLIIIFG